MASRTFASYLLSVIAGLSFAATSILVVNFTHFDAGIYFLIIALFLSIDSVFILFPLLAKRRASPGFGYVRANLVSTALLSFSVGEALLWFLGKGSPLFTEKGVESYVLSAIIAAGLLVLLVYLLAGREKHNKDANQVK